MCARADIVSRYIGSLACTALAWAAGWALPGLFAGVPLWLPVGFLAGANFSIVLALGQRDRPVEELSLARIALWGAIASAVSAVQMSPALQDFSDGRLGPLPFFVLTTLLGAGSAVATVLTTR